MAEKRYEVLALASDRQRFDTLSGLLKWLGLLTLASQIYLAYNSIVIIHFCLNAEPGVVPPYRNPALGIQGAINSVMFAFIAWTFWKAGHHFDLFSQDDLKEGSELASGFLYLKQGIIAVIVGTFCGLLANPIAMIVFPQLTVNPLAAMP